jgi:succinoglycan biosynthesis transport protein ExoP
MAQSFAAPFPASKQAAQPPVSEVNLSDIGSAVRRRWRWVALPTAVAFAGSLLFVNVVSPRYTGEAKLLLQSADTSLTRSAPERMEQQQIDEQAVASQVQVVMSRDLAREAIRRLNLVGNQEFDPAVGGIGTLQRIGALLGLVTNPLDRPPEDRVLDAYYDHLVVYTVGKSRIVSVEFRSKDAELASRAANTIAELYLALQEDVKKDNVRVASTWLGSNIDGLRRRVAEAEAKVEEFRSRTGLLVGSGTTTLSAQQLSELSAQLAQARTAQSDAQAKAKLIRDLIQDGRGFEIPDVANNELIRRLIEQRINLRAQLALEQRTLLSEHPRIKELKAQLGDLEAQLRGAAERTARMLENDSRIAGARMDSLEAAIDGQKKVVSQANEKEVQLRALEREARTQREQLESYLTRFREATARNSDNAVPPDARIVSRAVAPQTPSFPKKGPTVALATLAALLLSLGTVVARELLNSRPSSGPIGPQRPAARRDSEAESVSGREAPQGLGYPNAAAAEAGPAMLLPALPDPRYDFGRLVERLSRSEVGERGRNILVTGVGAADEARNVARGLALTLSHQARAILIEIEADTAGTPDSSPGLTDLVAGEASFGDVIHRHPASRLDLVPVGTLLNEALTVMPEAMELTLSAFEQAYEWVVWSLAPDAGAEILTLLAPRSDAVVIASNLEPASQQLVQAFEAAQAAGGKDVIVAREHALPEQAAEAA